MAGKTVEELQALLEKAQETQALATEGLTSAADELAGVMAIFEIDEDGNVGGTPEDLEGLMPAVRDFVQAVRANWKFRGLPTQTAERREAAIRATKLSQARKAINEGTATDEQVAMVEEAEAAKAAKG